MFLLRSTSTCNSYQDFPNNKMDRCKVFKWEVVPGDPYRVNIPCVMHDTRLCQIDVKMSMEQKIYFYP